MGIEKGNKSGFTLIELLVVIAVIALLMAIIMPALGKAKLYAQRLLCANNLRQQALGTVVYANDNNSYVPSPLAYAQNPTTGAVTNVYGAWFWDMSFWCTNQLCEYAGFDKTDTSVFTCPSNKMRKPGDALWWQFSWTSGGPSPVPLEDETTLSVSEQRANFRVMPNVYFFDKYVKAYDNGISLYDPASAQAQPTKTTTDGRLMTEIVIRKLADTKAAGSKPMMMDAIISNNNGYEFAGIEVGGIWTLSNYTLTDDTNHLSRESVTLGTGVGRKPLGANIAYADGHASWQPAGNYVSSGVFTDIKFKYVQGEWFWW